MIRLAARMEAAGMVAIAAAGFVEGCRPSVAEAVQHCLARGASEIIFQPYALLADEGMQRHIRLIRRELRNHVPAIPVRIGRPLGDHPALGQIVLQRANEADYAVAHAIAPLPLLLSYDGHMQRPSAAQITPFGNGADQEAWVPLYQRSPTGLVLIAEKARRAGSNWPLQAMCEWLRFHQRYHEVHLHLLTHGVEAFTGMIEHMLSRGIRNVVAVPYMLQMSKDDMATLQGYAEQVAASLPELQLIMAPHLGYDQRLVTALQQRLAEAVRKARTDVAANSISPRAV